VYSSTESGVISGGGFPTGVSGSATGGASYTIKGAPSQTGTFGYSLLATVASTGCTSTAAGTITVNAVATTPGNAASTQTWTFGSSKLVWSDVIQISPACNKSGFTSDYYSPQCRSDNSGNDKKLRYFYNWAYVNANGATLCPSASGWRVPTLSDLEELVSNTSYSALISIWGLGGYVDGVKVWAVDLTVSYWGDYDWDEEPTSAGGFGYYDGWMDVGGYEKTYGHQVRCVK
jgi:hypothetical protein